jgi:hypothetical protein
MSLRPTAAPWSERPWPPVVAYADSPVRRAAWPSGLGKGLQSLVRRFDSGRRLEPNWDGRLGRWPTPPPVHDHITFDNRTGHPFGNGDACPDEGLNLMLVGHGVINGLPSGVGCTHPYLLPAGRTVISFTVPTTRSGATGSTSPDPAGRYRIETLLYPDGLPIPPAVPVVLSSATANATATAHGVTVRLSLDDSVVSAGGTVSGRLTVTTPKAIQGCAGSWYAVGFTSPRTGTQMPGDILPDCGTATAIPAGTTSYRFKQTAEYQGCTHNPAQTGQDIPRCTQTGYAELATRQLPAKGGLLHHRPSRPHTDPPDRDLQPPNNVRP